MAHALFRRFLRDPTASSAARAVKSGDDVELVAPTAQDLAQLRRMYPHRARAVHRRQSPEGSAIAANGKALSPPT